jgi:hypothetical protein
LAVIEMVEGFVASFFEASISSVDNYSDICSGNTTLLYNGFGDLKTEFTNGSYNLSATTLRQMLQSVDPIAKACYGSVFEYDSILWNYADSFLSVESIVYNAAHNLGTIWDSVAFFRILYNKGDFD